MPADTMISNCALTIFLVCLNLATVTIVIAQDEAETRPISDFIKEMPVTEFTLSLSKDWAMQFDKDAGRGDHFTDEKELEIHNNLLEVAEMLHIIPEGSANRYSKLILLKENIDTGDGPISDITELSRLDEELKVSVSDLRRHGVTTFMNNNAHKTKSHTDVLQNYNKPEETLVNYDTNIGILPLRKYSPRLAMYTQSRNDDSGVGKVVVNDEITLSPKGLQ